MYDRVRQHRESISHYSRFAPVTLRGSRPPQLHSDLRTPPGLRVCHSGKNPWCPWSGDNSPWREPSQDDLRFPGSQLPEPW